MVNNQNINYTCYGFQEWTKEWVIGLLRPPVVAARPIVEHIAIPQHFSGACYGHM